MLVDLMSSNKFAKRIIRSSWSRLFDGLACSSVEGDSSAGTPTRHYQVPRLPDPTALVPYTLRVASPIASVRDSV